MKQWTSRQQFGDTASYRCRKRAALLLVLFVLNFVIVQNCYFVSMNKTSLESLTWGTCQGRLSDMLTERNGSRKEQIAFFAVKGENHLQILCIRRNWFLISGILSFCAGIALLWNIRQRWLSILSHGQWTMGQRYMEVVRLLI